MSQKGHHQVLKIRPLTDSTFVIRMSKDNFEFRPGQHVNLGIVDEAVNREYSSYSSPHQEYLEFLIREIKGGLVSSRLKILKPGNLVSLDGPFGLFTLDESKISTHKFLFIGTGTGIAPFHSFVTSYPKLDYQVLHGIRESNEKYDIDDYDPKRITYCVSQKPNKTDFAGRVTDYLKKNPLKKTDNLLCYLCGNSDMINDVYDILQDQGLNGSQIITEVFF